jgi:hypothetical protein
MVWGSLTDIAIAQTPGKLLAAIPKKKLGNQITAFSLSPISSYACMKKLLETKGVRHSVGSIFCISVRYTFSLSCWRLQRRGMVVKHVVKRVVYYSRINRNSWMNRTKRRGPKVTEVTKVVSGKVVSGKVVSGKVVSGKARPWATTRVIVLSWRRNSSETSSLLLCCEACCLSLSVRTI